MASRTSRKSAKVAGKAAARRKPTLLSGGNPQIAKADGDAPVQAYRSPGVDTMAGKSKKKTAARKKTGRRSAKVARKAPTRSMDAKMEDLGDWRGRTLLRVRALIQQADPEVFEEVKWRKPSNPMGVPVWSHDGIICTGEIDKDKVKLTFFKGAALEDPAGLFNAGFGGDTRRAIDLHEGDEIDEKGFGALVRAAVALNASSASV